MKILLLLSAILLISSCTSKTKTPFSGTFKTEMIRGSWIRCSVYASLSNPEKMTSDQVSRICDCFIDKLRSKYDELYIRQQVEQKATTGKFDPEYEFTVNQYGDECRQRFDTLLRNNLKGPYGYIQKDFYRSSTFTRNRDLFSFTDEKSFLQPSPT